MKVHSILFFLLLSLTFNAIKIQAEVVELSELSDEEKQKINEKFNETQLFS